MSELCSSKNLLQEREAVILLGAVVFRRMAAIRQFDAQRIGLVVAGDKIIEVARRAAIVEARFKLVVAAAIHGNMTARVEQTGLGLDVDHAAGVEPVFRGQCARDQFDRGCQPGVERLAEDADALGKDDSVDPELEGIVLAADMQLPERILHNAWHLQHDLIEQRVVAAGGVFNILGGDRIGRCAELCLNTLARFGQARGGDGDGFDRSASGGRGVILLRVRAAGKCRQSGRGHEKLAIHCLNSTK